MLIVIVMCEKCDITINNALKMLQVLNKTYERSTTCKYQTIYVVYEFLYSLPFMLEMCCRCVIVNFADGYARVNLQ